MPCSGRHVVLFAKAPVLGRVKQRLARDIGPVAAASFYRTTLARVARRIGGDPRWRTWLAATPDSALDAPVWPTELAGLTRFGQGPGDLGEKMACALRRLPPGPAVIVGGDIPDLNAGHIAAAFHALRSAEFVFGPAEDGGYWLVGARRGARPLPPCLFQNVRWSTSDALADSLATVRPARAALIDRLADVDDGAALARWRSTHRAAMA